jgi:transketolase
MKDLIKRIIDLVYISKEGHIPSSLSILDILYVFYEKNKKDQLILSKGHAAIGLYVILDHFKLLKTDITKFCQFGSLLGGHPTHKLPNIVASTGSLGHGLPIAIGMALGNKIKKIDSRIFVLIGDGESNEGTIWESALLASHHNLNNLCCIIDYNHSGDRALNLTDLKSKFEAFGWEVLEIDGHSHSEIKLSFELIPKKPLVIIANTIKGKGISIMENNPEWHHKIPNEVEYLNIIKNL